MTVFSFVMKINPIYIYQQSVKKPGVTDGCYDTAAGNSIRYNCVNR